jgi:hypothetical protein
MVPVFLPSSVADQVLGLLKNGGEVFQIVMKFGYDLAIVEHNGKVNWDDDHHG